MNIPLIIPLRRTAWLVTALAVTVLIGACSTPAAPGEQPSAVPPTPVVESSPVPPTPPAGATVTQATATSRPPAATPTPAPLGPQMQPSPVGLTPTPYARAEDPSKGPETAKVVIVEVSDFQ